MKPTLPPRRWSPVLTQRQVDSFEELLGSTRVGNNSSLATSPSVRELLDLSDGAVSRLRNLGPDRLAEALKTGFALDPGFVEQTMIRAELLPMRLDYFRRHPATSGPSPRRGVELLVPGWSPVKPADLPGEPAALLPLWRISDLSDGDLELALARLHDVPFDVATDLRMSVARILHWHLIAGCAREEPILDWFGKFWEAQSWARRRLPKGLEDWPQIEVEVERSSGPTPRELTLSLFALPRSHGAVFSQWAVWHQAPTSGAKLLMRARVNGTPALLRAIGGRLVELLAADLTS